MRYQLASASGCTTAYEDIGNVSREEANKPKPDPEKIKALALSKKCVDGSVYLNGTLPIQANAQIAKFHGTPFVDILLLEAEGKPMMRSIKPPKP